jgi:hypothetical protein
MNAIMNLVRNTSKSVEVYRQLVTIQNPVVFVQLVHDTDSDQLIMLIIRDFKTNQIEEYNFNPKALSDLLYLTERFGHGTVRCLNNVTSIFQSFEFENILRKVWLGQI